MGKDTYDMKKDTAINRNNPFALLRDNYNDTHDKKITQEEMANLAYVSTSTISRIEKGVQAPTTSVITAYCNRFNVSIEYLTGLKEPQDAVAIQDLGIAEEVITSYAYISKISNHNENLLAVLNSLIGNNEHTACLLQSILLYLTSQQTSNDDKINEAIFIDSILRYVNDIMKPQLQKALKHNTNFQVNCTNINYFDEI